MKKLLLFSILFYSIAVFSQESWGYLPVEITNNYHGAICPIDENVVHVVSDDGFFYKTQDGGETWSEFDSGVAVNFFDLAFDGSNIGYAVGDEGKIVKTANAGQTWAELTSGTTEALISVAVNAPNSIWAVGDNGTVLHSTNGGNTWTLNNSLTSELLNSIRFRDETKGYIAGNNGALFYTENAGADWEQLTIPTTDDLFSISITENFTYILAGDVEADFNFQYYSLRANELLKTSDNTTWNAYFGNAPTSAAMFFPNDNIGYMISSERALCDCCYVWIERSTDGGENWEFSLEEETIQAYCHANPGYADIIFATEDVGYALLGKYILKTPYESAGIEDFNKENAFTIYPNPTVDGNFNLQFTISELENLSVEIVDINGKKLFSETDLKETNSISIPNLSKGIYFIKLLKNGKMVGSKKIIKSN